MKRRDLLKAGSGAIAFGGLLAGTAPATAATLPPFVWTSAAAQKMLGLIFWLNHPQLGAIQVMLKSVLIKKSTPEVDQFSLVFGYEPGGLRAGTYDMERHTTGHFLLHLVPHNPGTANKRYRADFSLLR